MKWQGISVDIKTLSLGGYLPLLMNIYSIKSDFKEIFFLKKLVANDLSDKRFLLTSNFCHLRLPSPDLWLYTFIKSWKDVYKVRIKG